ncbi:MAG TPA: 6-carboxytetrahydropterin synthase QueD [Terriglobia bacterium]|jgi:6-pyruvoyltetrahydropterin/6-carboxytetrahydropterin synthase|nr:6-carboxytetrahydropterin synthase QueD [Terriglobia bacterium]
MFEITVEYSFAAGHALRGYHGKCENIHGHNYKLEVTLCGNKLNSVGLLMDFVDLKAIIKEIVKRVDHQFLNDLPPFDRLNPSAENMAKYFFDEIRAKLGENETRVKRVKVWETEVTAASYSDSPESLPES